MTDSLAALVDDRFGMKTGIGRDTPSAAALARILARRCQRRFRPEPIPEDLMAVLLACAQSAPTKSDLQAYSIIRVEDRAKRAAIAEWVRSPWLEEAAAFLMFCGDMRRNQRLCAARGLPHRNNNLDSFFNSAVDAALAMQSFILAAESVGLGICPISQVRNRMAEVTALLALPPGVYPVAGLAVGWPAGPGRLSMRLPPSVVVHRDRYDDSRLEAEVAAYDERRFAREPLPPGKQKNEKVYGPKEKCPWSQNVAQQLSIPERVDFAAFLKSHGFELS